MTFPETLVSRLTEARNLSLLEHIEALERIVMDAAAEIRRQTIRADDAEMDREASADLLAAARSLNSDDPVTAYGLAKVVTRICEAAEEWRKHQSLVGKIRAERDKTNAELAA